MGTGWSAIRRCVRAPRSLAWRCVAAAAVCLARPNVAHAHPGGLDIDTPWWQAWHFDWLVAVNLMILSVLYAFGLARMWEGARWPKRIQWWRPLAFAAGIATLGIALMSPLDTIADDLSWVHMCQHMVLMVVAAPLIVAASPGLVVTWALPIKWRKKVWRGLSGTSRTRPWLVGMFWNAFFIWTLHAAILWIWHLPTLYQLALRDQLVHDFEHLTFFVAACLFWRIAIDAREVPTLNPGLSVLYLFTTSLHATVLGVLMALSPKVWYPVYIGRTERWGLTALEDQQLAGLIMWMPACMVYALAAAALLGNWLSQMERSGAARDEAWLSQPQHRGRIDTRG
ncbi:MAG: cytochrome c oxidase assembly protein, partial [Planctomycetaceae bacterium]